MVPKGSYNLHLCMMIIQSGDKHGLGSNIIVLLS